MRLLSTKKKEIKVFFSASGTLISTETKLAVSYLPQTVKDYANKTYPEKKQKKRLKL